VPPPLRDGSKSVATADVADLESIMAVNVTGPLLCCREAGANTRILFSST